MELNVKRENENTDGLNVMWFSGFTDGSVVLTKGDITRDRHSKTLTLHEGTCPVTGLAFRQAGKVTHLFVATLEKVQVCFKVVCLSKGPCPYLSPSFIWAWFVQCVTEIWRENFT